MINELCELRRKLSILMLKTAVAQEDKKIVKDLEYILYYRSLNSESYTYIFHSCKSEQLKMLIDLYQELINVYDTLRIKSISRSFKEVL